MVFLSIVVFRSHSVLDKNFCLSDNEAGTGGGESLKEKKNSENNPKHLFFFFAIVPQTDRYTPLQNQGLRNKV